MHREIAAASHPRSARRARLRPLAAAALASVLFALAAATDAGAASLPAGTTAVISGTPDLLSLLATPVANSSSGGHAVSEDGTRIVFSSSSDGLVAGDDDSVQNVYVKDLATGAVQLVSRASGPGGEPAHADCSDKAISGDGNRVAFVCDGSLDPADANGDGDVYVRDLATQQTTLVSRASGVGQIGNGASTDPAIDRTGRFVAFASSAGNLVSAGTQHGFTSIYRREIGNGDDVVLVSCRAPCGAGDQSTTDAERPSISDDGAVIAFDTTDSLVVADTNSDSDVYVHDLGGNATSLVSRADGPAGGVGAGKSTDGIVSGDGKTVAFASSAPSLDPTHPDTDTVTDVYARNLTASTTRLVSVRADGTKANGDSDPTSIDDAGDVIAFTSFATNLGGAGSLLGTYVRKGGDVQPVDHDASAVGVIDANGALDGDGTEVSTTTFDFFSGGSATVLLHDLGSGTVRPVSRPPDGVPFSNAGGSASGGSVSADGRYVAFASQAQALGVSGSTAQAAFVRDVATGAVTLVSRADGANGAPLPGVADDPHISADGRRVAFVLRDGLSSSQVYVRDIPSGRTLLVSRADGAGGVAGDGSSDSPSISDDGRRVAFLSAATNLEDGDVNDDVDVHVRDIDAGRTFLADRADGAAGDKAGKPVDDAAISGDGRHVAFSTDASLATADGDALGDVYVRDVDGGSTRLVSVTGAGVKGDRRSFAPSIDRDGNRVGFISDATNLGAGNGTEIYVRDVAAGTLAVAGPPHGSGLPVTDSIREVLLSADGNHVAFVGHWSTSIAPGAPIDGFERAYQRDLATGATRLISRRSGTDGALSTDGSVPLGGISADGGCVTFGAFALLPPPASTDFRNVYMRAVTADCGRLPDTGTGPGARAAVLSRLSVKPARFHVGGRRGGTRIAFRLDRASSVTLAFDRLLPGHRKGRRCLAKVRRGRRCTVARRVGRLTVHRGHTGANSVKFSGRLGRKALAPGRYRLTATPAHGNGRSVRFVVVRGSRGTPHRRA